MNVVKIAQITDFNPGDKKKVKVGHKEILVTNISGTYYAIDNACSHMGGSLYDGKLDGTHATCPRHGSTFDVTTGKVVQPGKMFHISVGVSDLHSYPVRIEGTDILLEFE